MIYDPGRPWSARRDAVLAMMNDRHASARRRAYFAQLAAEAAGRSGDPETCVMMLQRACTDGLFDLHWLDRCPLLESVRGEATLERTVVAINDQPVSIVLGARCDSAEWIGQLAARFALFQHRDARVSLKK